MVPRQVNPHFTGRRHMLQRLRGSLCPEDDDVKNREQKRFVICGMGGSGKSEVCLKFANENRDRYVLLLLAAFAHVKQLLGHILDRCE